MLTRRAVLQSVLIAAVIRPRGAVAMNDADLLVSQFWAPLPVAAWCPVFDSIITTQAAFDAAVDRWAVFMPDDVWDAPTLTLDPMSVLSNGVLTVDFTLNGKSSQTYAWGRAKEGAATETTFVADNAVLIIPGSGDNQAQEIVNYPNPPGLAHYHGAIMGDMRNYADTFCYVRAGHDFRAQSNGSYRIAEGVFSNNAELRGTSYYNNEMIEVIAVLKWLKTRYQKVGVIGLSQGALKAAMATLMEGAAFCVASSGVSVKSYDTWGFGSGSGNLVTGLETHYPKADFLAALNASPAQFLITYGTLESTSIWKWEADNGYTAAQVAGFPRVTVTSGAWAHVFPQPTVDNFVAGCL